MEQLVGKMGIEALYNATLTGKPGEVVSRLDGNGYVISGSEEVTQQPKDGNDLYLTLDKKNANVFRVISLSSDGKVLAESINSDVSRSKIWRYCCSNSTTNL